MRRIKNPIIVMLMVLALMTTGCAKNIDHNSTQIEGEKLEDGTKKKDITLTIRGAKDEQKMMQSMLDSFCDAYSSEANIHINFDAQQEDILKKELLGNIENGPDIFIFPDDQLKALVAAGVLEEVKDADKVKESSTETSINAAMVNDKLYAYPLTADNGYFLYYNSDYFTTEDIKSFDRILEVAEKAGKKVSMEINSAWYHYAFYGIDGLEVGLNEDGITNYCNWNTNDNAITGVDVAKGIMKIANHKAFVNLGDKELVEAIQNGTVIAGINGIWNSATIKKAWGKGFSASKLPTYTVAGQEVQMISFSGYRFVGVNAYSENTEWAEKLAQWLLNEENQTTRYEEAGQVPCNSKVLSSIDQSKYPVIAALNAQQEFASLQRLGNAYWSSIPDYGNALLEGNLSKSEIIQKLDTLVENITAQ